MGFAICQKSSDSLPFTIIYYYLMSNIRDSRTSCHKTRIKILSRGNEASDSSVSLLFINSQYMENNMTDTTNTATKVAKLNEQSHIAFRDWAKDTYRQDLTKAKRVDILIAAGWTSTMCVSPKNPISTATEASWEFAKNAINSGFPKAAQELMAATAKVAGDKTVNGQPRAYWARQANAVLGDIKNQLARREQIAADIASGKQGADARTRTPEDITYEALMDCVARIQKAENFKLIPEASATLEFVDLADFCSHIKEIADHIDRS